MKPKLPIWCIGVCAYCDRAAKWNVGGEIRCERHLQGEGALDRSSRLKATVSRRSREEPTLRPHSEPANAGRWGMMATQQRRQPRASSLSFTVSDALARADAALENPPPLGHIMRPEPSGSLVARFVLPLRILEAQNRRSHAPDWAMKKKRGAIWVMLNAQMVGRRVEPLPGRPMVRCIRFSSVEPDKYADTFKAAIDALCVPSGRRKHGLGFLRDDKPKDADIWQTWEPAPPGRGFGLIEVFEDANARSAVGAANRAKPSNRTDGKADGCMG